MSNKTESAVAIAVGLGLGALAMYLMDPDKGQQRRSRIASSASDAVSSTRDAAEAGLHRAGQSARSAAGHAAHYAKDLADRVIDEVESRAHDIAHAANDAVGHASDIAAEHGKYLSGLSDRAGRIGSRARDAWSRLVRHGPDAARDSVDELRAELADRVKRAAGVRDYHPVAEWTGHTLGTFGFLVVGAGAMYFLDPARGRSRRAWVSDKISSVTMRTGRRARSFGRHLGNKAQGYVHEASRSVPEPWRPSFMRENPGMSPETSMPTARTSAY